MNQTATVANATSEPAVNRPAPQLQRPSLVSKIASKYNVDPKLMLSTLKSTAFKQQPDRDSGALEDVTNEEMMMLLIVADQHNLNPFTREIYAFRDRKRGGIVPVVGIDGWARIVNEHPQFDGSEFAYGHLDNGTLEWCECTHYRKDRSHPTAVREFLKECKRNTDNWNGMPSRMLRHRAFIQAARITFGFGGLYDDEEARAIIEGTSSRVSDTTNALGDLNASITTGNKPAALEHNPGESLPGTTIDGEYAEVGERKAEPAPAAKKEAEAAKPSNGGAKAEVGKPPVLPYATVREAIEKAKTIADRMAAEKMILQVADEAQRSELIEIAKLLNAKV